MTDSKPKYILEAGFDEAQGRRETMEDTHCVINNAKEHVDLSSHIPTTHTNVAFWGVFDGHGGVEAAQMVEKELHKSIFSREDFKSGDIIKAINGGFETTDNLIVTTSNKDGWMNGSTAVCGILVDDTLFIANIGDSEAVLVKQNSDGGLETEACTTPHKASDPNEKRRIESLGGHVFFGRVFGALAVSRSFGDSKFKMPKTSQNFVSWEPAIKTTNITTSHKFLILACDGLWDVMTHQEAAEFVSKLRAAGKNATEIAKALVREALNKKTEDNVTIVVVFFNWEGDNSSNANSNTQKTEEKPQENHKEEPSTPVVEQHSGEEKKTDTPSN